MGLAVLRPSLPSRSPRRLLVVLPKASSSVMVPGRPRIDPLRSSDRPDRGGGDGHRHGPTGVPRPYTVDGR